MQKLWKEPVGWEGGRDGEAINRADWSWISCIGQAAGIEWPKLTALFSTFTAKASLFPGGLRTRESRRDNLMKTLPRCPLLTLLCREEPNGFGSLLKLKWFMFFFESYNKNWNLFRIHFNYWWRDDPFFFYPTRIARNKLKQFQIPWQDLIVPV